MGQNRIVSHGGAWVLPQLQMHQFLSLEPVALDIPLKGALSLEKIRVNVPSVFTYAVGKGEGIKQNAAERLLGLEPHQIDHQAEEIIIGQMRGVLASLTIEQINRDREAFITEVQEHCAVELNKLGLVLLNTNVQNITDDSGVIDALGRKAAETARQEALVDVATGHPCICTLYVCMLPCCMSPASTLSFTSTCCAVFLLHSRYVCVFRS